ncbi:hypothetical protein GCM10007140_22510 [Priestia taiwanensis]|uniref:CHK kinase-like domain-containing protein n=2 Tax=Priestia taiwanensis TaxID=1347902 RepID=A0A917ASH1_9BACI|nr:hypothetical protein GCM10007140_22510 [Priestia taiwanensis]
MGDKVSIDVMGTECLKTTRRMSVYKVPIHTKTGPSLVILKVYHSVTARNEIEINLYMRAYSVLQEFLPPIYLVEQNKDETWIFMGFVQQVRGQITFQPAHFEKIIPSLAKLHAKTFEEKFSKQRDIWTPWLPVYSSTRMTRERTKYVGNTIEFLDEAMRIGALRDIIKPHYKSVMKLYEKGPDFFPELIGNGSAVTHGDLHLQNICSNNVTPTGTWKIQFIDWEAAKFSPVWFDMVVLVEILIAFRKDWQSRSDEIRTNCVKVYTEEMAKQGIRFKTDPMKLIKMAYVQRTLEKGLHTQLRRIFDNRGGELLPYHLERATTWARELGL